MKSLSQKQSYSRSVTRVGLNMNEKIRALCVPQTSLKALGILLLNIGWMLLLLLLVEWIHNIFFSILCAWLFSSRLKCINNIIHECFHQSFTNNKKLNHFLGRVLCLIILTDYTSYKEEHRSHHEYLGDYKKDLDFQARKSLKHDETFTWHKILLDILKLKFIYYYFPRINFRNIDHLFGGLLYSLLGLCAVFSGHYAVVCVLILSHCLWMPLHKYFIDIVDHGGLYDDRVSKIYQSRNFIIRNKFVRELLFPRNDCYHLVHHLYPFLPVKHLADAHQLLMEDSQYKTIRHDWQIRHGFKKTSFSLESKDFCYE